MKTEPRKVFIQEADHAPNMMFVTYVERKKHTKYDAASFDKRHSTRADVVAWVKANPKLVLVENPSPREG